MSKNMQVDKWVGPTASVVYLPNDQMINEAMDRKYEPDGDEVRPDLGSFGYKGPGWYWYDETWANVIGPYETRDGATTAQMEYVKEVFGE